MTRTIDASQGRPQVPAAASDGPIMLRPSIQRCLDDVAVSHAVSDDPALARAFAELNQRIEDAKHSAAVAVPDVVTMPETPFHPLTLELRYVEPQPFVYIED